MIDANLGKIVILNGAPRSGKSSIAAAIQNSFDGLWMNLGVDRFMAMTPSRYQPGMGLRPGGERPDLEPLVDVLYRALYESIAAHSRLGINVVADIGHHDHYATKLNLLPRCASILKGYPVLFVGVRCPIDIIMERRIDTWKKGYEGDGSIPKPILLWQEAVHTPGIYDMEADTSIHTPEAIAERIRDCLDNPPFPTAFERLAL